MAGADVPKLLVTGGDTDIVDPDSWAELPPSLSRASFTGHLPFVESRDECLVRLLEFFDTADGKVTNREFKFADPVTTLKEML